MFWRKVIPLTFTTILSQRKWTSSSYNDCPTHRLSFCTSWHGTGKKAKCFLRLNTTERRTRYSSHRVKVDCEIFARLFLKAEANKQAKYVCIWADVGWNSILGHANIALASFFGHICATKQKPFANHTAVAFTLAENQTPRLFLLWSAVTDHRNKQRVVFLSCSKQDLLFSHGHQWQREQARPVPE